jgi:hypothetical protein
MAAILFRSFTIDDAIFSRIARIFSVSSNTWRSSTAQITARSPTILATYI